MIGLIEPDGSDPADRPAIGYFQNRRRFRTHVRERVMIAHMQQFPLLFFCQGHQAPFHRSLLPDTEKSLVTPYSSITLINLLKSISEPAC